MSMKKLFTGLLLMIGVSAYAQKAVLVDIVSENILKVKMNNEVKRVHLSGIELFSRANHATKEVSLEKKEAFKKLTLAYLKKNLPLGSTIEFAQLDDGLGVNKIWLNTKQINYRLVRDGFALVNIDDASLPTMFKMRMTMAMKYAKDKKLGLWKNKQDLLALINKKGHMCGWENATTVPTMTKQAILKELKEALPKNSQLTYLKPQLAFAD